jgi:hypothetical protein
MRASLATLGGGQAAREVRRDWLLSFSPIKRDFLDFARLQEPNPLLYRCFRLPALVRRSEL